MLHMLAKYKIKIKTMLIYITAKSIIKHGSLKNLEEIINKKIL